MDGGREYGCNGGWGTSDRELGKRDEGIGTEGGEGLD